MKNRLKKYFVFDGESHIGYSDEKSFDGYPDADFYEIPILFNDLKETPYLDNGILKIKYVEKEYENEHELSFDSRKIENVIPGSEIDLDVSITLRYYLRRNYWYGFNWAYGYDNYPHANSGYGSGDPLTKDPKISYRFNGIVAQKRVRKIRLSIAGYMNDKNLKVYLAIVSQAKELNTRNVSQTTHWKGLMFDTTGENTWEYVKFDLEIDVDIPKGEHVGLFTNRNDNGYEYNRFLYSSTNIKLIY